MGLPIEVESIDFEFTFLHIELFLGNPLGIESNRFVDCGNTVVIVKFLGDLAIKSFEDSYFW